MRVVFHGSADHRSGNARPRFSSSLCELRVLHGAHCDWIASLLNATGAIQHEYFDGSSPDHVFVDQDPSHGFCSRREEMTSIVPFLICVTFSGIGALILRRRMPYRPRTTPRRDGDFELSKVEVEIESGAFRVD